MSEVIGKNPTCLKTPLQPVFPDPLSKNLEQFPEAMLTPTRGA